MAGMVAEYLRSLPADEVAPAARMIIGRVFPEREDTLQTMRRLRAAEKLGTLRMRRSRRWTRSRPAPSADERS